MRKLPPLPANWLSTSNFQSKCRLLRESHNLQVNEEKWYLPMTSSSTAVLLPPELWELLQNILISSTPHLQFLIVPFSIAILAGCCTATPRRVHPLGASLLPLMESSQQHHSRKLLLVIVRWWSVFTNTHPFHAPSPLSHTIAGARISWNISGGK